MAELHGAFVVRYRGAGAPSLTYDPESPVGVHAVAMAHPHLFLRTNLPDAVEDGAGLCHTHHRAAELAVIGCLHPPAELLDHGLLTITNAKYRYAQVEDLVGRPRRIYVENRCRPAGQYDRPRIEIGKRFPGDLIEWMNFAINAL